MFIQCSDCDYKYIVNSADLKPDGRMVECANCNHRWYQEPLQAEELLSPSLPSTPVEKSDTDQHTKKDASTISTKQIKNLPSTLVREKKVSLVNTFLLNVLKVFLCFWYLYVSLIVGT